MAKACRVVLLLTLALGWAGTGAPTTSPCATQAEPQSKAPVRHDALVKICNLAKALRGAAANATLYKDKPGQLKALIPNSTKQLTEADFKGNAAEVLKVRSYLKKAQDISKQIVGKSKEIEDKWNSTATLALWAADRIYDLVQSFFYRGKAGGLKCVESPQLYVANGFCLANENNTGAATKIPAECNQSDDANNATVSLEKAIHELPKNSSEFLVSCGIRNDVYCGFTEVQSGSSFTKMYDSNDFLCGNFYENANRAIKADGRAATWAGLWTIKKDSRGRPDISFIADTNAAKVLTTLKMFEANVKNVTELLAESENVIKDTMEAVEVANKTKEESQALAAELHTELMKDDEERGAFCRMKSHLTKLQNGLNDVSRQTEVAVKIVSSITEIHKEVASAQSKVLQYSRVSGTLAAEAQNLSDSVKASVYDVDSAVVASSERSEMEEMRSAATTAEQSAQLASAAAKRAAGIAAESGEMERASASVSAAAEALRNKLLSHNKKALEQLERINKSIQHVEQKLHETLKKIRINSATMVEIKNNFSDLDINWTNSIRKDCDEGKDQSLTVKDKTLPAASIVGDAVEVASDAGLELKNLEGNVTGYCKNLTESLTSVNKIKERMRQVSLSAKEQKDKASRAAKIARSSALRANEISMAAKSKCVPLYRQVLQQLGGIF
ncbi:hypothetical protein ERJ75_000476300 [Trypanosoma vivax]|uniref:Uncharacterized protein n=1 Tax=Trypanosoma vivax (strain Y486) TaxID=1055687 RepID=F9WNH4_TRYVY|nr:hypothetical protein ERJ75_000476300 [Trypanosoma vivax]CCD19092.1 hypothetical protein, conserved in T. vivax [Trypanosoma vivax Y486]|eukprot:CCD19092.1 hypothetical protein, conserved in T. vivax [Trypanosoma vivax Y486]